MPVALYSFLYEVHNWDIAHRELLSAVDTSPGMNTGGPLQDFTAFFNEVHYWDMTHRELLPAVDTSPGMNAGGPLQGFTASVI